MAFWLIEHVALAVEPDGKRNHCNWLVSSVIQITNTKQTKERGVIDLISTPVILKVKFSVRADSSKAFPFTVLLCVLAENKFSAKKNGFPLRVAVVCYVMCGCSFCVLFKSRQGKIAFGCCSLCVGSLVCIRPYYKKIATKAKQTYFKSTVVQ